MPRPSAVAAVVAVGLALAGCGSASDAPQRAPAGGPCPVAAVNVVVSIEVWGAITRELGGQCANVTTVLADAAVDPHDFAPSPADGAAFGGADLVVVNGAGYDPWAVSFVGAGGPAQRVVDGGQVVGVAPGANPHLWYDPGYVEDIAAAVTAALRATAPAAAEYFGDRATAWRASLAPYLTKIEQLRSASVGKTFAATEGVFDYMATAVGLQDLTPPGWHAAALNDGDPAPGDVAAFDRVLSDGRVDVLVQNSQTEGAASDQVVAAATGANVPVVEVSESVPADADSFVDWQVGQLDALAAALGTT